MYFWRAVNPKYAAREENLAQLTTGEIVSFDRACNDRDEGSLPRLWKFIGEGIVLKINGKYLQHANTSSSLK